MTVARHLGIKLSEYDRRIRTFIPAYDDLLQAAASALTGLPSRPTIVELGIGTGALAKRLLQTVPRARLTGIDADAAILAVARRRLGRLGFQATWVEGDFAHVPLPRCDAIVASLALHHVRSATAKQRLYERCAAALSGGGVLVNADAQPPTDAVLAQRARTDWRRHLRHTYSPQRADAFFKAWAAEDRYFPLRKEQAMLEAAGFDVEVCWRAGCFAVVAARIGRPSS